MAVRLIDGFDLYTGTSGGVFPMAANGWAFGPGPSLVAGQRPGQAISSGANAFNKVVPFNLSSFTIGHSLHVTAFDGSPWVQLLYFYQSGVGPQCYVQISSTGLIRLLGAGGAVLATGVAPAVILNTYHYIEIEVDVANAGRMDLYVDGSLYLTSTGDTQEQASAIVNQFAWGSGGITLNFDVDDLYIADVSTRIGVVQVETLRPDSDGSPADWTPSSGSDAYAMLDETLIDGDASYIADGTVGEKTQVGFGALASTPTDIYAVQASFTGRRDDLAARECRLYLSQAGGDTNGATKVMDAGYVKFDEIVELNPISAAAWTGADIDALQVGVEVVS